ncbi:TetR/AcrR family transcriptional regulator [Seohaeicola zhoushanensis]
MPAKKKKNAPSNISRRRQAALDEGAEEYVTRRRELVRIAATIFKAKGFDATTFGDIAVHTGLDRATLYYYFGSKQEIFKEAIEGALSSNLDRLRRIQNDPDTSNPEKLEKLVRMLMVSYHDNYPYLFVYLQQDIGTIVDPKSDWAKKVDNQVKMIEAAFAALIRAGIAAGDFRDDISVSLCANSIFGMLNWTHRWYDPEGRNRPEVVADAFCKIFFDGLRGHSASVNSDVSS